MVQFHTEGLRQPTLVGKDPAGNKIPGGPYVVWQGLAVLVAPVMWNTTHLWGRSLGPFGHVLGTAAAVGAVFWLIGRIDFAGRNPFLVVTGLAHALRISLTTPGRLPYPVSRPHRPDRAVIIRTTSHPGSPTPILAPAPVAKPAEATEPTSDPGPPAPVPVASPASQAVPATTASHPASQTRPTPIPLGATTTPAPTHAAGAASPRAAGSRTPLELFLAAAGTASKEES